MIYSSWSLCNTNVTYKPVKIKKIKGAIQAPFSILSLHFYTLI